MTNRSAQCFKCQGTGVLPAFKHVENGKCYQCHGAGTVEIDDRPCPKAKGKKSDPVMNLRNAYRAARSNPCSWAKVTDETENFELGYDCVGAILADLRAVDEETRAKAVAALLPLCSPYVASRLASLAVGFA